MATGQGIAQGLQPLIQFKLAERLNERKNEMDRVNQFIKITDIPQPDLRDAALNQWLRVNKIEPDDPMIKDLRTVLKKNDEESVKLVKRAVAAHGKDGVTMNQMFQLLKKDPVKFMDRLSTRETLQEANLAGPRPGDPVGRARELESRAATIPSAQASGVLRERAKTLRSTTEPDKSTFGGSIRGRSQEILTRIRIKENKGIPLSQREQIEKDFAVSNLTAPRDVISTDPLTGERSLTTIRPQLPERFQQPPSGRISTKPLEPQSQPKKLRLEAANTKKEMGSAKKKLLRLIETVRSDPGVTGASGRARKIGGSISRQVGGPGFGVTNVRSFEKQLESLRADLKSLVDKGKFSDEDRKRLELLVSGTGLLDDPESTLQGFQENLIMIEQKIEEANQILNPKKQDSLGTCPESLEGRTSVNAGTGQRAICRGGQWRSL